MLSCIDCGKDFWGDSYKEHTRYAQLSLASPSAALAGSGTQHGTHSTHTAHCTLHRPTAHTLHTVERRMHTHANTHTHTRARARMYMGKHTRCCATQETCTHVCHAHARHALTSCRCCHSTWLHRHHPSARGCTITIRLNKESLACSVASAVPSAAVSPSV